MDYLFNRAESYSRMSIMRGLASSRCLLALVALLAGAYFGVCTASLKLNSCTLPGRLPQTYAPRRYNLSLEVDMEAMSLQGKVAISVEALVAAKSDRCAKMGSTLRRVLACGAYQVSGTSEDGYDENDKRLVLNVGRLIDLKSLKLVDSEGLKIKARQICIDKRNQMMAIELGSSLSVNMRIKLTIEFSGRIGDKSRGFYHDQATTSAAVSSQQEQVGGLNANTHFMPADARLAFPCFDEPAFKAPIQLELVHAAHLKSFSNSPVLSSETFAANSAESAPHTKKRVMFETTPEISTYLFGFAVGNYDSIECRAEGDTKPLVTAYTPVGRSEEALLVLDTVCQLIPQIENYFQHPYPLYKLDLVVTQQMSVPARENWGMIVFTEPFLLTDADTTNVLRAEIVKLAAHNVLHQWFGNLVTANWWDDQWIFDGFTIWRSHAAAAGVHPEFSYDFNYLLRLQSPMLDSHASLQQVHAIKTYQNLSAEEEFKLFDENTYNKAGAIYNMLNGYLGENGFRDILARFIRKGLYGTGDVDTFVKASYAYGAPTPYLLINLMPALRSWLDLPGVPLVHIAHKHDYLEIRQERLVHASKSSSATQRQHWVDCWWIPTVIVFGDHTNGRMISRRLHLYAKNEWIRLPDWYDKSNSSHYIKLNRNFESFYRVQYSDDLLDRLKPCVERQVLGPADRFNVIDDLRALYKLNRIDAQQLSDALGWYAGVEQHGGVLSGLALALQALSSSPKDYAELAGKLFRPIFEKYRFEETDLQKEHSDQNGRQDALLALVQANDTEVLEAALEKFDKSDVHLTPFLRKPVYAAVLRAGSEEQFAQLIERMKSTRSAYERQILIAALAPLTPSEERRKALLSIIGQ